MKISGSVIDIASSEAIVCRFVLKRYPPKRAIPANAAGWMANALLLADELSPARTISSVFSRGYVPKSAITAIWCEFSAKGEKTELAKKIGNPEMAPIAANPIP